MDLLATELCNQSQGDLMSDIENPRYLGKEHFKVVTLRSGKTLEPKVVLVEDEPIEKKEKSLEKMLNYVKFMKDILSIKKRLSEYETVALTKECNAFLQNKLPPKLKDLRSFTIPSNIEEYYYDRSLSFPEGKIQDVLVKVNKFTLPDDFIVLDLEADKEVSIILGRPFLPMGRTLIDVQKGEPMMRVQDD
ncbi:uncharacterized protein [Gossypium hirsutum]|uniref:Uncharacterized protein n=1 Tax=Gossypium hirsutum TaxID=3635 RepID=A0A1U8PA42_GOSHI|nr:uncharacterized protein LOC107955885 [Gossypium hirsutum]